MRLQWVLAALLFFSAAVSGQPPQDKKDAQSEYEPRSRPGTGQAFLKKFEGDWTVAKTFYPRSGEPVHINGECHQTMINEGRFLKSEFVFEHNGSKSTGLGLIGFEPGTEKFTSVWTDSRQTRMSLRQSQERFNGEEIVLYSRSLRTEGRPGFQSRTVTRLEDGGNKIVHRQYAPGPDKKERLMMELVLTRKPSRAGATE
jgi:Protein of unknown function (DUF1579)